MDDLSEIVDVRLNEIQLIPNINFKDDLVNKMSRYLIMQDILEFYTLKEINVLSLGLFESVIGPVLEKSKGDVLS